MIRITPEHIYVLRDSTGKPFTDLLDHLIRSSAATLGIAPSGCARQSPHELTPTAVWIRK